MIIRDPRALYPWIPAGRIDAIAAPDGLKVAARSASCEFSLETATLGALKQPGRPGTILERFVDVLSSHTTPGGTMS